MNRASTTYCLHMKLEISKALSPTSPKTHSEVSERARWLIVNSFYSRGRFTQLQERSGISSAQWRNFYYGRQRVNEKMLAFVLETFPSAKTWVLTGKRSAEQTYSLHSDQSHLPFSIALPTEFETVGQRLSWAINEWTPLRGRALFAHLSEMSAGDGHAISTEDWAQVILKGVEPTVDMLTVVCRRQTRLALWVLCGSFKVHDHWGPFGSNDQIDPSNHDCVSDFRYWDEMNEERIESETGITSRYKTDNKEPTNSSGVPEWAERLEMMAGSPRTRSKPSSKKTASSVKKHGVKKG